MSPVYETVQDDVAQASESPVIAIEEFMRQEVPQIFTSRLQNEVSNMKLEEAGSLEHLALQNTFIARMSTLINEAQDAAVEAYRQKQSENSSQLSSNEAPYPALSQGSRSTSQPWNEPDIDTPPSNRPHTSYSWAQTSKSIDHTGSEENNDAVQGYTTNFQGYITNQIEEEVHDQSMNTGLGPDSWLEFNNQMESWLPALEQNIDEEWAEMNGEWTAPQSAQQVHVSDGHEPALAGELGISTSDPTMAIW